MATNEAAQRRWHEDYDLAARAITTLDSVEERIPDDLGGYAWGMTRERALLAREAARAS